MAKSMLLGMLTLSLSTAGFAQEPDATHKGINDSIEQHWGMEISQQEIDAINQAMSLGREISRRAEKINGLPYRRDAHAKATGCLRATFSVNGDIPAQYQHSIFSVPGQEYQAWIRFSNGDMTVQADSKPDARGMAIKVVGVKGNKIAPEFEGPAAQDFIMTNTPAFFNRNVFDYVEDMHYLAKLQRTRYFISLFPPRLHPRLFYRAIQTVSKTIATPLQPQYYSMLPYRIGQSVVKFSAKACPGMVLDDKVDTSDKDFLTTNMQQHLLRKGACFDVMFQDKVPGANMPVDDASVIWSEKDSPFVPVARVMIPPQLFTSENQQQFCENLSMNPWHGVGEWEPLGSLNRARRVVYQAVSAYRHQQNDASVATPTDWCLPGEPDCNPLKDIIHSKPEWPLPRCFDSLTQPLDDKPRESHCERVDK
ncbi:catalase family protein [Aestuariibacter halophilus]|uniref:Catalase family protein n=1 Tax=Fluctibacter halophilus TaxID=226011 RepID=A0ABS8G5K7_9ALTE|nr:catalase family protein [Aestuariibacter halophilus]MCC2615784.1 catalase family protein [Aestuariibacter halophilus]